MTEYYSNVYVHHISFIHSSIHDYLGWFYNLAIVTSEAINMNKQISFLHADLQSFGYTPRNAIAV
jgi:hypothetical protein